MAAGLSPQSPAGPERRVAPRVPERLRFAFTHEGEVVEAESKNLSISGAYCTTTKFIPPMTKLQVQFDLPHNPRKATVRCTGVVVRAEPVVSSPQRAGYHLAIFFSDLSPRDREAIAQFVKARLASTAPAR